MIDEAVRLGEVAVTVAVVAVALVERAQVARDLRSRPAGIELTLDPVRHRVADQKPGVVAGDAAADVAAVAGLVERHLHPRGHLPVDGVAARRLRLVVPGHPVEVHVPVVRLVVVGLPQRRVVYRAVRRRDAVVRRPVEDLRVARGSSVRVRVLKQRARMARVPEFCDDDEDRVRALAGELDPVALGLCGLPLRRPPHLAGDRRPARLVVLQLERQSQVVPGSLGVDLVAGRRDCRCRHGTCEHCDDAHADGAPRLPHHPDGHRGVLLCDRVNVSYRRWMHTGRDRDVPEVGASTLVTGLDIDPAAAVGNLSGMAAARRAAGSSDLLDLLTARLRSARCGTRMRRARRSAARRRRNAAAAGSHRWLRPRRTSRRGEPCRWSCTWRTSRSIRPR